MTAAVSSSIPFASTTAARRLSYQSRNKSSITELLTRTFKVYNTGELNLQVIEGEFEQPLDLYCAIGLGPLTTTGKLKPSQKTPVLYKCAKPMWNHSISLEVKNRPEEALIIRVKDYTRIGKDREIGRIIVPASVWEEEQRATEKWFDLEGCKGGKLKLRVSYITAVLRTKHFYIATKEYSLLQNLLEDKDYYFLNMLSVVCTDADLALALIRIFNTSNHSLFLINSLLRKEITRHQGSEGDPNTLFRSDSPATRIIREYFHLISRWGYLQTIIKPIVIEMINDPVISTCIVNGSFNFECSKSCERLMDIAKKLIRSILESVDCIPKNMRKIFVTLAQLLKESYSCSSVIPAVNLLFLRFLCPNVLFPWQLVLTQENQQNPIISKACILVTKILQNAASCTFFVEDDPMRAFNGIIREYGEKITDFLLVVCDSGLVEKTSGPLDDFRPQYSTDDLAKLMATIVHKIHDNIEALGQACRSDAQCPEVIRAQFEKLSVLIEEK